MVIPTDEKLRQLAEYADMAKHADLRGTDPEIVAEEVKGIIARAATNRPRDLQRAIGPSELGHPCPRHIAYTLRGTTPAVPPPMPWRQTIGTCVGDMVDEVVNEANENLTANRDAVIRDLMRKRHAEGMAKIFYHFDSLNQREGYPRWYVQTRVPVGHIADDYPIEGNLDVYDLATAGVIDVKAPGVTQMKAHKPGKKITGEQYRVQVMSYARGIRNLGLPCDWVGILRLPIPGEWGDVTFQWEPYDEDVAVKALTRVSGIYSLTQKLGGSALNLLPAVEHFCHRCDFHVPDSTDLATGCPGARGMQQPWKKGNNNAIEDLVG